MERKELAVSFTETAAEEVTALVRELRLLPVAEYLYKSNDALPEELKDMLTQLLAALSDLFSVDLPDITSDPETSLRIVSRDINLAKLLRERGLFRLYRLVTERIEVDPDTEPLPMFMTAINPETGYAFTTQDEFIGWFCQEAHVARGLVFQRKATIDRLVSLGYNLDEVFGLVLSKPYVIQQTIQEISKSGIGRWDQGTLVDIDPGKALQITRKISPGSVSNVEEAIERSNSMDSRERDDVLRTAIQPVLGDLLEEVSGHERAKDAMSYVKYDVFARPEISYEWDRDSKALVVHLQRKNVDPVTGASLTMPSIIVPFVPDALDLPEEIIADLLERLPIRNRYEV